MKILHIISSLNEKYGGPSILLPQLTKKQKENNNKVEILTTYFSNEYNSHKDHYLSSGIKLRLFKVFTVYRISLKLLFWLFLNLKNYDCIHVHSIYRFPTDITILLSFFQKFPLVFSPHGSLDPYLFNKSQYRFIGIFSKKIIHLILHLPLRKAVFHFTAQDEKNLCSLKNLVTKNFIIPPLVIEMQETKFLNKDFLKSHLKIKPDSFLIGYIGRLHEKKNIDSLIKGFNLLSDSNLKLVIIGPGSNEYRNYLKNIIKNTKNKNIFLMDSIPHDQLNKYMYSLDLYALPSHSENFGITILEALSLKIPVLISDKVNIYKDIEKYSCGRVIKDNSYRSIALVIKDLVSDKLELKKMHLNTINLINAKYSWETLIPKYIKMYQIAKT